MLPVNPILPGVQYIIGDVMKDPDFLRCPFIFLDTDHDGIFENPFYDYLCNINWKGILLLDDIHSSSKQMDDFWERIKKEKHDISSLGHWSGTGLVYFK